ncbi:MAG: hypothetical protein WD691_05335 [Acidimicrobiales bacterium]
MDNSFFTHLATGRIILETGSVPATDPYTFTAPGADWLVQSWLASYCYALAETLAGGVGIRLFMGLTAALLVAVAWRLTSEASSVIPRLAIGVIFVATGAQLWAERPLMLGLIGLGCVMLAGEGALDPRWLVPIAWVWVNVHGSFPLGVVYLVVLAVGSRLDGTHPRFELRALRWLVMGVVVGAVGPLGPAVLLFPLELVQRQDVLQHVTEWRAPTFDSLGQRVFLLQVILVLASLVRRPSYRSGLVVIVFLAAALVGLRNVPVAALVFLPVLAAAAPTWGSLRCDDRSPLSALVGGLAVAAAVLFGAARAGQHHFELSAFPIDALAFLRHEHVDLAQHHMVTKDSVGNLIELLDGPREEVFYDDRFDMFPDAVSRAHLAMVQSGPTVRTELETYGIELVLWQRGAAVAQRLIVDPEWRVLYTDDVWVLLGRRGTDSSVREAGGSLGVAGGGLIADGLDGQQADDSDERNEQGVLHQ